MDNHDPKKTLKTSPIEFTGGDKIVIGEKLKKILKYLGGAVVVTVLALLIPFISILLVLSMPAAFGLGVYAVYLWYKSVLAAENKPPDWSQIEVPTAEQVAAEAEKNRTPEDTVKYN